MGANTRSPVAPKRRGGGPRREWTPADPWRTQGDERDRSSRRREPRDGPRILPPPTPASGRRRCSTSQAPEVPPGTSLRGRTPTRVEQKTKHVEYSPWSAPALAAGCRPSRADRRAESRPRRVLEAIAGLESRLDQRLGGLQTLFDREIRAEATRERIVDRLHAELQEYKQDLLLKVQRPIFVDLIQLHDDIGKMIDAQPAGGPRPRRRGPGHARVDPHGDRGHPLPPGRRAVPRRGRRIRPPPPARRQHRADRGARANKTIADRLRPGFQAGDKLIRPEIVSVYTLKKYDRRASARPVPARGTVTAGVRDRGLRPGRDLASAHGLPPAGSMR